MPIYEYTCATCGKVTDVIQKVNDPAPGKCDHCGAEGSLSKIVSRSSFVLKGGGWYSDLYSSTKKGESKGESSSSSSPSSPSSTASSTSAPASSSDSSSSSSGSSSDSGSSSSTAAAASK